MITAAFALTLVTALPPNPPSRPVLREAIAAAAHESAVVLDRAPQRRQTDPAALSPRGRRRAVGIIVGAAAGFLTAVTIGFESSRGECGPARGVLIAATAGGGALGWWLAGE
jgi:hypothetical protein